MTFWSNAPGNLEVDGQWAHGVRSPDDLMK